MDVALVGFIGGFVFGGWRTGFLRRVLGIVFLVVALVLGAWFRYPVGAIAATFFKDISPEYANLVGYTIAFPAILAALHIASARVIGRVGMTGVSRNVDASLGAVFGGVEAILIISALAVVVQNYAGTDSPLRPVPALATLKPFADAFLASTTVKLLHGSTIPVVLAILGPILPKDVSTLVPAALPSGLPGIPRAFPLPSR